jgi:DNA polymerase III epsilon subunit-like protein
MKLLFLDTETSGLISTNKDLNHPEQGRVMQLSWFMCDENQKEIASCDSLIIPDGSEYLDPENGWKLDSRAFEAHKITLERCYNFGLPRSHMFNILYDVMSVSDLIIGHNISFDVDMVVMEFERLGMCKELMDKVKSIPTFCTMHGTRNIVKALNSKGYIKSPNLTEAFLFFTGNVFENAHNSKYDVEACKAIYFEAKKRNLV